MASAIVGHAKKTKGFAMTSSNTHRGQGVQNYMDKCHHHLCPHLASIMAQ